MSKFHQEFHTLNYVIKESDNILLFAHARPDGDTTGSVFAMKEYIKSLGKKVDIACFDPLPEYLKNITEEDFEFPARLDLAQYKLIIACDSVERGFHKILPNLNKDQVTVIIDHHPDITIKGDITIIDPTYSSVCELIYEFLIFNDVELTRKMATYLTLGILSDTGMFQHSNTTPQVLEIASILMKKGAPIPKIVKSAFSTQNISTLKLWGKAFEKARFYPVTGMIASVITVNDMTDCQASNEDISQVATILNTVPGAKFALVLSERENGTVKGSLRSESYKGVDVSQIAATFGGGGHKLASGFELKGRILETEEGWKII